MALPEGVSSATEAIAISASATSLAPWSDESSSLVVISSGWPHPRLDS